MTFFINGKGNFTPAPEGLWEAVCVDLVDLGIIDTAFGRKHMIRLVWELECKMDDARPFIISKRYTPSLHEKANLHKDLKAWRGRAFTPEELDQFDLETVVGAPCRILVVHNDKDGTTYSNINAIMRAENKLSASGDYTRVKDRPDQQQPASDNGHTDSAPPPSDDADFDAIPF